MHSIEQPTTGSLATRAMWTSGRRYNSAAEVCENLHVFSGGLSSDVLAHGWTIAGGAVARSLPKDR